MATVKEGAEIVGIRKACAVAAKVLALLKKNIFAGVTTLDLDEIAFTEMKRLGAESACFRYQLAGRKYPAHVCLSINDEVVHGIPSLRRVIYDGDIVSVDVVVRFEEFIGDNACTVPVGAVSASKALLLSVAEEALKLGIRQTIVGNRIGDISSEIQTYVERHGFSVVREMVGHGVGRRMHEEPQIPNFGQAHTGAIIRSGMTLAIEPMVNLGRSQTSVQRDGWTIVTRDGSPSAHFEHTVLTTDWGPEVLTDSELFASDVTWSPELTFPQKS